MGNGPINTAFVEIKPKLSNDFESQVLKAVDPALKRAATSVERSAGEMGRSFDSAGDRIEKTFDSTADSISADAKRAGDSIDRGLSDGVNRASNALGSLKGFITGVAATAAATKGVEFLKGAIDSASDLGETLSKIQTQLGDHAVIAVEKFANSAAKSLGQSRQEALDAIGTFNTLAKSAGLAGSDAGQFSISFDKLAVDLASFNNTSTDEAVQALGAALRGESEPIRRFGVLLGEAELQATALADGMIKPTKNADNIAAALKRMQSAQEAANKATKEFGPDSAQAQAALEQYNASQAEFQKQAAGAVPQLTAQQKVLAARTSILKQTTDAQGDAVRTGGALAGQQKRLSAAFADAQQNIGKLFLPAIAAVITAMNDKLLPVFVQVGEGLKKFGNFFKDHIEVIKKVAAVIAVVLIPHYVKVGIAATVSAAQQVAAWVATKVAAIQATIVSSAQVVIQIAKWIALGIAATANAALVAAAWLISIGPIALVVAAVVGLAIVVVKNFDTIKNAISTAFNWVKDNWPLILAILTGPIGLAVLAITKNWDKIKEGFGAAKDFIARNAKGMWDGIKDAFRTALNWVITKWNNLQFTLPSFEAFGKKIGGFTLGVPDIPTLHTGGMFHAPAGQSEGLALLKDKETVLPPGFKPGAMFGPGSVVVTFAGAMPTEAQAYKVGYAVGSGAADAIARQDARRARRMA